MNIKIWTFIIIIILGISLFSCKETYKADVKVIENFELIEPFFSKNNDTTYVINFWATTCPPCLRELPLFEKSLIEHKGDKFKIILVNIDDKKRFEKYVLPFLEKLKIKNKVFALVDDNMTSWTAKVNEEWYGALPYTVIYKNDNKKYYFGAFKNEGELEIEVDKLLK